jgi:hypothetical protein
MRPKTTKANMRDKARRLNKRKRTVILSERRNKRSNKRRMRQEIRSNIPNKNVFTDVQLGEREGKVVQPRYNAIQPTCAEMERDILKDENERMQNYIKFLLWRINEQAHTRKQEISINVNKGQVYKVRNPTLDDIKELAGVAC